MRALSVKEIELELKERPPKELLKLCLRLAKFKKENKELLTYLVFESVDEQAYITGIKQEMDEQFDLINTKTTYYIKKSVRKILRRIKTYIRYSKITETGIELLIYFCQKMKAFSPPIRKSVVLSNIHKRELEAIKKKITALHEDLQYDYSLTIDAIVL